jgi:hypothetical protein
VQSLPAGLEGGEPGNQSGAIPNGPNGLHRPTAGDAMSDDANPQSSMILYRTEDGLTRVQCRFENETIWLTQALIAELFQKDVRTINEHLVNIYDEGELSRDSTIRNFRIVRLEGSREVVRAIEHYSLPMKQRQEFHSQSTLRDLRG